MARVAEHKSNTGDTSANLAAIISEASGRDRNEAETRHKIIDFILHDLLSWPKNRVVTYYFGVIGYNDSEFMDRCYVSQREYQKGAVPQARRHGQHIPFGLSRSPVPHTHFATAIVVTSVDLECPSRRHGG